MNGEYPTDTPIKKTFFHNNWHDKLWAAFDPLRTWKPEKFFDDDLVIALCHAIEGRDVNEIERLIAAGADVNALGRGQINPLYWAYHVDDDPRPFECLFRHGADPNVIVDISQIETHCVVMGGWSVSHCIACRQYNRLFRLVFENGGDPNLRTKVIDDSVTVFQLLSSRAPDIEERVKLLAGKGADLNVRFDNGHTKMSGWTLWGSYDVVMVMLELGADYQLEYTGDALRAANSDLAGMPCRFRLIHFIAEHGPNDLPRPSDGVDSYNAVVSWLEDHGESLSEAKKDLERWRSWKEEGLENLIEEENEGRGRKRGLRQEAWRRGKMK